MDDHATTGIVTAPGSERRRLSATAVQRIGTHSQRQAATGPSQRLRHGRALSKPSRRTVYQWRSASIDLVAEDDLACQLVSVGAEQIGDELGDPVWHGCLINPDRDCVDRDIPL